MGLFSSKSKKDAPPVRRDVVRRLIKLGMEESDAGDRDIDSPEWKRANRRFTEAKNSASQAEVTAANEALSRHGYY